MYRVEKATISSPTVTVCVPTYNHALYLEKAVDSIISQNIDRLHLIISDDASQDGTDEICKALKQKYPEQVTLVLHPKNVGILDNIESLYENIPADTKYVAWFSGDDLMLPGKLEKQVAFLDAHPDYVMCYHDTYIRDSDRDSQYRYNDIFGGQKAYEGQIAELLVENGCFVCGLSVMVRWQATNHIRHRKELSIYNDWAYFIEIAMLGKTGYLPELLGVYRRHNGNITRQRIDYDGPVSILEYMKEKYGFVDAANKGIIRNYLAFGFRFLVERNIGKCFELYKKALQIAFKKPAYALSFIYWNGFLIYQRIGIFLKTGKVSR